MIDIKYIKIIFQELLLDMYQHIFENLSQKDLLNILITNKFMYNQLMKYIKKTKLKELNENKFPHLKWNYELQQACKSSESIDSLLTEK